MSYPSSFDVSDGLPTSYTQYNRLRADALRFGAAEPDGVPVGVMFRRYSSELVMELLDTDRVRVLADGLNIAGLMVGSVPLYAFANVDLPLAGRPSGGANTYYVFAVRSPGSQVFTLAVNTTPTETTNTRLIGRFYWDGVKIVPGSVRTEQTEAIRNALGPGGGLAAEGRLTLTPSTPVTTADVASSDVVYYSPYLGNRLALYVPGWGWTAYEFGELMIPLAGKSANKNLDVFLYWDGAAVKSDISEWAANNARGYALTRQDGVLVKPAEPWKRYMGTLRTYAAGLTCDTRQQRLVWNFYNRQPRTLLRQLTADTWTENAGTWHTPNAETSCVEIVTGDADGYVELGLSVTAKVKASMYALAGIGDGVTNAIMTADHIGEGIGAAETASSVFAHGNCQVKTAPMMGYHQYNWLVMATSGPLSFYGSSDVYGGSGLIGTVLS